VVADSLIFPPVWRRAIYLIRAVLGLACLVVQLTGGPEHFSSPITALAAVFFIYSLAAPFLKWLEKAGLSLLMLFFETVFFLVFASYGGDHSSWVTSLFYLYLLLSTVISHDWGDVFIVAGGCVAFFGLVHSPEAEQLRKSVMFAGLLACVLAFQKRKLQEHLTEAARTEGRLRDEVANAREAERQKIAGDFHDGPLQSFIGVQVRLDILRRLMVKDPASTAQELADLQEMVKSQIAEIRSFLREMKPPEIEGTDLMLWMRRVVEEFHKDTGIPARFCSSEAELTAPPETCREVLQILREALHNVQKHSQAGRVAVSVERAGKTLEISVDDNGAGFAFSGSFSLEELELLRLGPQSIKRRVRSLGGELLLESRPGHGSGLKIRIPS
jgi:signal transduction histidine kinase